ncbi:MAG: YybH family protein [Steroidobacteraceae bacterium]
MNILKSATIVAAGMLVLAACEHAAVDTSADESAIRASTQEWETAYGAGDGAALGAHYAEDAVLLPPNAPAVSGRAAIGEFLASDSAATGAAGLKFDIAPESTVQVSGDLAYEAGTFQVMDATGAAVGSGKFIGVFNKQDGKWLLVRDTWNADAPPAPAPAAAEEAAAEPAAS